jgi:hypothetical protein
MNQSIIPALSALAGSFLGGMSTFAASWFSQNKEIRAQILFREIAKRENLYSEFIAEAAKRFADAWTRQADGPDVLAELYGQVHRMQIISSAEVIRQAEGVLRRVTDAYAAPVRTYQEARDLILNEAAGDDLLKEFTRACLKELDEIRPYYRQRTHHRK